MRLPLSYTVRNLWVRKLTTLLTAGGMALVVYVFATVLMLSEGLRKTLVDTGSMDNVVVIRRGAETEVQSSLARDQAALVANLPGIANDAEGDALVSKEVVVLMVMPKRGTEKPSNVTLRGLSASGLALRPQVRIRQGRLFRRGSSEVIAGNRIAAGFSGAGIGEKLKLGPRVWTVVGIFDAGNTAFASEIWGDVDQMMQAFRRESYSSVLFRLADSDRFDAAKAAVEKDQRLTAEANREPQFYAEQSEAMSTFLRILGVTLSVIFSVGAIIGAMITMYASVANRTAEIGTLRAIGFRRRSILAAFLTESVALSLFGGVIGLLLASLMQFITVSTMNWQTFAELAFGFAMTGKIIVQGLVFALLMGIVGGLLPAARAARMRIVEALRAA